MTENSFFFKFLGAGILLCAVVSLQAFPRSAGEHSDAIFENHGATIELATHQVSSGTATLLDAEDEDRRRIFIQLTGFDTHPYFDVCLSTSNMTSCNSTTINLVLSTSVFVNMTYFNDYSEAPWYALATDGNVTTATIKTAIWHDSGDDGDD